MQGWDGGFCDGIIVVGIYSMTDLLFTFYFDFGISKQFGEFSGTVLWSLTTLYRQRRVITVSGKEDVYCRTCVCSCHLTGNDKKFTICIEAPGCV